MIFNNISDLALPINTVLDNINYKNANIRDKLNDIIRNKKLIHVFDNEIDNIILYSIYGYDNLNCFIIFGKNKNNTYKYYANYYEKDYILYGIKNLKFTKNNVIFKIMYQLLFPRMIIKTKGEFYNYLKEYYPFLYNLAIQENSIISFDITILLVCKRDLLKKYPSKDIIEDDFTVIHPNTKEEIWHAASLFFCNNSIKFIEMQNFDYFLIKELDESKKMFLKYRKWLITNIEPLYQQQFMLFSSIVLYLLGHRAINDLDLYVHTIPENIQEKLKEFNENKIYNFIDFKVKNTDNWLNYWDTWLNEWAQKSGAKYFEEILGNPEFYFYFLGVKIISIECDITRRIIRNRPRAIADLIALRKRYSYAINIPEIPKNYSKYIDVSNNSEKEIIELIKENNGVYNERNKEISIIFKTDINKFINTIIYALQTRYRMQFTISEIYKELKMPILNNIKKNNINININKITSGERKKVKIIVKIK
jgi:hypothetical protein